MYENVWKDRPTDFNIYHINNVFKTEEEAEFMVEKLKVIHELKQFAEDKDRPWDTVTKHWTIYFDSGAYKRLGVILINSCAYVKEGGAIYFESEEKAREALKAVGEDRVKKYYLEVGE